MPVSTIIMVVIVVGVALLIFNFIFESFRYIINIVVIVGLVVWLLFALGMINNLPNVSNMYNNARDAIMGHRYWN